VGSGPEHTGGRSSVREGESGAFRAPRTVGAAGQAGWDNRPPESHCRQVAGIGQHHITRGRDTRLRLGHKQSHMPACGRSSEAAEPHKGATDPGWFALAERLCGPAHWSRARARLLEESTGGQ
jgi:hypothetical protein